MKLLIFHVKVYQEVLLHFLQEASGGRNSSSEKSVRYIAVSCIIQRLEEATRTDPCDRPRLSLFKSLAEFLYGTSLISANHKTSSNPKIRKN